MRAPAGLDAAGKKAWERALRVIEDEDDKDRFYDLAARYAQQVDIADKARRQWRRLGSPMTTDNPNGAESPHPLLKVINDADKLAHRFGERLKLEAPGRQKHRGPNPQAVVEPEIGESPAVQRRNLRRVK